MLKQTIKVEGNTAIIDFVEALDANMESSGAMLATAGVTYADAVRELRRAEAHRAAARGRMIAIAAEEHKGWPEWKVKAQVDGADELLALAEGVVQAGRNVMILEAFLRVLAARLDQPLLQSMAASR